MSRYIDADNLISRQAAIDAICEECHMETDYHRCEGYKKDSRWCEYSTALNDLPSAQPEQPSEIQDILDYLDTALHPIISPEHWSVYSELHDMISTLPSAQQWIPCSERLPDKSGRYLVTNTRLGAFEVTWNIFYNGKGEAPEGWLYEDGTIAWMPLPEPYKGEES